MIRPLITSALAIALLAAASFDGLQANDYCPECVNGGGGYGAYGPNGMRRHRDYYGGQGAYYQYGQGCIEPGVRQVDLFYNYYSPMNCGAHPAAMYTSPRPTPPLVGHTYYTYQPMLPHEMMYTHHRSYHAYYDGGAGLNRTHVSWYVPPGWAVINGIKRHVELPR
jgi:hypothetical protein